MPISGADPVPISLLSRMTRTPRKAGRVAIAAKHHERARRRPNEVQIGVILTFVAGAVDAGGFLLLGQFTAHMSGNASSMADHLHSGAWLVVLAGVAAFLPFLAGAAVSAMLIGGRLRYGGRSPFVPALLLESSLLLAFAGFYPTIRAASYGTDLAIAILSFAMGLQNATSTSLSITRMRTTQVTGIATDLGLELGRLLYWNRRRGSARGPAVVADRAKLAKVGILLLSFLAGGFAGASGFSSFGPISCAALAIIVLMLACWMWRGSTEAFS